MVGDVGVVFVAEHRPPAQRSRLSRGAASASLGGRAAPRSSCGPFPIQRSRRQDPATASGWNAWHQQALPFVPGFSRTLTSWLPPGTAADDVRFPGSHAHSWLNLHVGVVRPLALARADVDNEPPLSIDLPLRVT